MARQGVSTLDDDERDLVLDALAKAASRHEVEARYLGGRTSARRHDDQAEAMRRLRRRLLNEQRAGDRRALSEQVQAIDDHMGVPRS